LHVVRDIAMRSRSFLCGHKTRIEQPAFDGLAPKALQNVKPWMHGVVEFKMRYHLHKGVFAPPLVGA
jgi:hypothetical protein